jgi:hypothetical protein
MLDLLAGLTETGYNAAPISGRAHKPGVTRKWPLLNRALFGAEFAPICALLGKAAEKPGENCKKSAGKWRRMAVFRRHRAPFRRPRSRRRQIATRQPARAYAFCCLAAHPSASPGNWRSGAIFLSTVIGDDPNSRLLRPSCSRPGGSDSPSAKRYAHSITLVSLSM